jgi:hypothetical protein
MSTRVAWGSDIMITIRLILETKLDAEFLANMSKLHRIRVAAVHHHGRSPVAITRGLETR